MLDMGSAIPRGVRGAIMAAYRTFEAGGTNGQAVALLTTANQSIVTAIANGLSTKADVRGLVALHDSMKTALTQTEQHGSNVAANAANDVGVLFSSYFDAIGADDMPPLSEFAKLYREGGSAWQELTLRKQWKEAVRNGEIGFFTEFDEYKAMAAVDGQRGVEYNEQNTDILKNESTENEDADYKFFNVKHAVGSAKQAQSVLDGINPKYFNSDSRFGGGFYVGGDSVTIVAELAEHGNIAKYAISYDLNMNGQKVLDLTNSKIAAAWEFTPKLTSTNACQDIAETAKSLGYNVVKFESYRGDGINYVIFNNFEEILIPRIVTPID